MGLRFTAFLTARLTSIYSSSISYGSRRQWHQPQQLESCSNATAYSKQSPDYFRAATFILPIYARGWVPSFGLFKRIFRLWRGIRPFDDLKSRFSCHITRSFLRFQPKGRKSSCVSSWSLPPRTNSCGQVSIWTSPRTTRLNYLQLMGITGLRLTTWRLCNHAEPYMRWLFTLSVVSLESQISC